jgi:acetyl-CoA acyltransferase
MAVDLQRMAFKGLVDKTAIDRKEIDYVISGTVIQEVKTSNIAREAAVNAGLPISIGAHTVSMVSSSMLCVICYMFMLYIYVICYDRICCYDLL